MSTETVTTEPIAPYRIGDRVTILESRDRIRLSDGREIPISYWKKNAPPIICDPKGRINGGRPTSVYDLMYMYGANRPLTPTEHAIPTSPEGDDFLTTFPIEFRIAKRGELKKLDEAQQQPGPRAELALDVVAAMRKEYFDATKKQTLAGLAKQHGLSIPTIRKYVFGGTAWYA